MSTAVVLGAGMAGLLHARVLSDRFDDVAIVERDRLPDDARPRIGVPQGRHAHGFLASGGQIVEELFPGITRDLEADGADVGDKALRGRWFNGGAFTCRTDLGLPGYTATRPLLELHVRRRLLRSRNVRVIEGHQARGLITEEPGGPVVGVRMTPRSGTRETTLSAALVIDATGRASRLPQWLEELGWPRPAEERVQVDLGYATCLFARSAGELGGDALINIAAHPPNRRMGVAMAVEGDRWLVTLAGLLGEHPPLDEAGFKAFARALPSRALHDLIADLEPLGPAVRTRFAAHRRVRYERVRRAPGGVIAVGDAMCSFNPVYGQGMSVAAKEAVVLAGLLDAGADRRLPQRFARSAAKLIDVPWDIAVGNDLRFAEVQGPRTPRTRLVNRYMSRVLVHAAHDPDVARAVFRVGNLLAPPQSLLTPRMLAAALLRRPPRITSLAETHEPVAGGNAGTAAARAA